MDKTTAIDKIKVLLGIIKEQKFTDVKLKDGTIMRYEGDTPMVGMPVTVVTADGELPAPDGKYEIEDGSILDVQGGIVANIEPKAAEGGEAPVAAPEKMLGEDGKPRPTKVVTTKETVFVSEEDLEKLKVELSKKIDLLVVEISDNKKANEALKAENIKLKKQSEDVLEVVKQIADEPGATPIEKKADKFDRVAFVKEQKKGFKEFYEKISK